MFSAKFFGFIRVQTKLSSQSTHLFQSKLPTTVFSDVMIGQVYCHGGRHGTGSDQCQKRPKFTINMLKLEFFETTLGDSNVVLQK